MKVSACALRLRRGSLIGFAASAMLVTVAGSATPALPDGRVYEQVSPVQKNGGDVMLASTRTRAAVEGDAFGFSSLVAFGDVHGTTISSDYLARRSSTGWTTHGITPQQHPMSGVLILDGPGDALYQGEFADDLSKGVVRANAFPVGEPNVSTVQNLFVRRDLLTPGLGAFELVTSSVVPIPPPPFQLVATYKPFFVGASTDFRHVVIESIRNLTQDTVDAGLPDTSVSDDQKLYEWVDGRLRSVGILPPEEGGGLATHSVGGRGVSLSTFATYSDSAVSDDGSRIYFTTPETGQLYVRIDGSSTVRVNASERRSPDLTPAPARFQAATPDGMRVFFTTQESLTDEDTGGRDLYRYDATAPEGRRLTRLSIDGVPGDSHTPEVEGALDVSEDGEWAYFIARGALVPDMPAVEIVTPVVYAWHAGELRYVGKMRSGLEVLAAGEADWARLQKGSRVTPDGRHAVFLTTEGDQVVPHDHGNSCFGEPCVQLYAFDANANGGAGELTCVSCEPNGGVSTAPAGFNVHRAVGGAVLSSHLNRPLSDDGRFVFFHTNQALLPEDRNDRSDVYEFNMVSRSLHLISSGRASADDSYFLDASLSGRDVFFASRERLVGWDSDESYDAYDARVGGGFSEPPLPVPSCVGEACQGSAPGVPRLASSVSSHFAGAGNVTAKAKRARKCKRGKVRKRVRGKVRCVRRPRAGRNARGGGDR